MKIVIDPNKAPTPVGTGWRPGGTGEVARRPTFAELTARAKANGTFDPKAAALYLRNQVADARTHVGFDEDWARAVLASADELDPETPEEPDRGGKTDIAPG